MMDFYGKNRRLKITGPAVEVRKYGGFIQLRLLGVFFVKEIFREEFDEDDEVASPSCSAEGLCDGFFRAVEAWRIIPVSKWLTMVSKSPKYGCSPSKWSTWLINSGLITNHLQVLG